MTSAAQAFNQAIATSPELQAKLEAMDSPMEFLTLAQEQGVSLTPEDFQGLAQQAYQQWLAGLDPRLAECFQQLHDTPELHSQLQQCRSVADGQALGTRCGVELTEADLQRAAAAAKAVPGFSFEKFWFRSLGLLS